jgi:hypothetical protein
VKITYFVIRSTEIRPVIPGATPNARGERILTHTITYANISTPYDTLLRHYFSLTRHSIPPSLDVHTFVVWRSRGSDWIIHRHGLPFPINHATNISNISKWEPQRSQSNGCQATRIWNRIGDTCLFPLERRISNVWTASWLLPFLRVPLAVLA